MTRFFCTMNFLDILIVLPVIYGIWVGFKKGLVIELCTFLALFLGLYGGIHFSDFVSGLIMESFDSDNKYIPVISFTLIFLLIGAMVYFAGKLIEKAVKVVQLSLVNKLIGALFGGLKFAFLLGGLIMLLESYDEKSDFLDDETKTGSLLYVPLKGMTSAAIPAFNKSTIFLKNTLYDKELLPIDE